jgi:hypothetical protein
MKKWFIGLTVLIIMSFFSSCTMSNNQMNAIAKQSGMITAISWISTDNPSDEVKNQIKNIISLIEEKSNLVNQGQSYTSTLQPILDPVINNNVSPQYQGLVKLGSTALLSGIDLLFAMYPEVSQKEDVVVSLIHEFCSGAQQGLSLSSDSKIMKAIEPGLQSRVMISRSLVNNQK